MDARTVRAEFKARLRRGRQVIFPTTRRSGKLIGTAGAVVSLSPDTRLGPYEIVGAIGASGMGEVYKARDTRLDRAVATKILPEHTHRTPQARKRFEREAEAISTLNYPHICRLHDVGHQDGVDFLVMGNIVVTKTGRSCGIAALAKVRAAEAAAEVRTQPTARDSWGTISTLPGDSHGTRHTLDSAAALDRRQS